MIIDTHAHLGSKSFDEDRDEAVAAALAAGVDRIITIGTSLTSSREAIELADRHPSVFVAAGIHPTDVCDERTDDWTTELERLLDHPKVVAIGETGLDHFHPAPDGWTEDAYHRRQVEFFLEHLELAERLDFPVIVHQRESHEAILEVLEPFHGRVRCVFHCWNQSAALALDLVEKDHRVSFTGIATFKSAADVQACAAALPAGTFFLETDSPYLSPVPHRGKKCQPAYVRFTGEHVAQLREVSPETLFRETTEAALAFFKRLS